jgi:nucleoside-diphosphate-sugar epimerase
MRILILGASGYIGSRLADKLSTAEGTEVVRVARGQRASASQATSLRIDTRDLSALTPALRQCDCVVNCVAGDFDSIAGGARILATAARDAACRRIVHLSSMAVYGRAEGQVTEDQEFDPHAGWYARAKCEAEGHMREFAAGGGEVVTLRPGCVFGPAGELWVGRIARWLIAGRLGDLGVAGDGWSNLVHLDDVCDAVIAAMRLPASECKGSAFNIAAPDSPRWNDYFVDVALALSATPIRRISTRQLKFDSILLGPPLKMTEKLLDRVKWRHQWLPDPLPPSVRKLWPQLIRLDTEAATHRLAMKWTRYRDCVGQLPDWWSRCRNSATIQSSRH